MESYQSCVAMLGAGLWGSCRAVQLCSLRRVLIYLLHAYKQWEEDICRSSSTTLHSIHFIPYSYPFPLLVKQLSTSGSISGLIKLKRPLAGWLAVWLTFPSFLFLFGIVRLPPTGRP